MPVDAIICDFDGTIANTWKKNYQVTSAILKKHLGNQIKAHPVLKDFKRFVEAHVRSANWREFYRDEFGLEEKDIDYIGQDWKPFQLKDNTPAPVFRGIKSFLHKSNGIPKAIVSQNSRDQIRRYLTNKNINHYFQCVIGYEEVPIREQKPAPYGLFVCLKKLNLLSAGIVLYMGDHETDVELAKRTNMKLQRLNHSTRILAITITHGLVDATEWQTKPDYLVHTPKEILALLNSV